MKRLLVSWIISLVLIIISATPVAATGGTGVTGTISLLLRNVAIFNISSYSATVSWKTNIPADSQVEYGTTIEYGLTTPLVTELVTSHVIQLSGLTPSTTYHFRVRSAATIGGVEFVAVSADSTFTTSAPAPSIVLTANPVNIAADGLATSLLTATVNNQYGNPVPDGTEVVFNTDHGTLGSSTVTKQTSGGLATATLTSESSNETIIATVMATANGTSDATAVFFIPEGSPEVAESQTEIVSGSGNITNTSTGGDVNINAIGAHSITIAQYEDNPVGTPSFQATGNYYDVHLDDDTSVNSLTIEFWPVTVDTIIYYWDGANWLIASNQYYEPTTGSIKVTITASTFPRLSDLTGLILGPGYTLSRYQLTVKTDPLGLSPAPTAVPASLDGFYNAGTVVTLTANAISDYTLNYWSVDGSNQGAGKDKIEVPMSGPHIAVAHYVPFKMNSYFTDSDFNRIDSFDVVFTPGTGTSYKMVATNPGTFYYNLQITNNGASGNFTIQVAIPGDFVLKPLSPGANPVQIDGIPVSYNLQDGLLSISGVAISTGQTVRLTAHLDYALKSQYTATQPYTADSQSNYLKQYSFSTSVNLVQGKAATVIATGKKVTAIGGFAVDVNGVPKNGLKVTVTDPKGGKTNLATGGVMGDGFYFLIVPAGGPYTVQIFNSLDTQIGIRKNIQVTKDTFVEVDFNQLNPADPAIQGVVRDNSSNPISGVTVKLLAVNGKVAALTTTNNAGYYVFRFSQPGVYTVRIIVPPGYSATTTSVTIRVSQFQTISVDFNLTKK